MEDAGPKRVQKIPQILPARPRSKDADEEQPALKCAVRASFATKETDAKHRVKVSPRKIVRQDGANVLEKVIVVVPFSVRLRNVTKKIASIRIDRVLALQSAAATDA